MLRTPYHAVGLVSQRMRIDGYGRPNVSCRGGERFTISSFNSFADRVADLFQTTCYGDSPPSLGFVAIGASHALLAGVEITDDHPVTAASPARGEFRGG